MIKKKYNKKLKLLFLLLSLTAGIETCYGATVSGNGISRGSYEPPSGEKDIIIGSKKYIIKYKYEVHKSKTIEMNAIDMNGQSLIPNDISETEDDNFKAGTWVGINVTENQTSSWKVHAESFKYYEVKHTAKCLYTKYVCIEDQEGKNYSKSGVPLGECERCWNKVRDGGLWSCECYGIFTIPGTCGPASYTNRLTKDKEWDWEAEEAKCPDPDPGYTYEGTIEYGTKEVEASPIEELEEQVINSVKSAAKNNLGNPTADINYIKLNDYPINAEACNLNPGNCYGTLTAEAGELKTLREDKYEGAYAKDFQYIQQNVCINVKTADVTYGRSCNEDEMKLENIEKGDRTYWKYFIPLNAKSSENFWLQVIANNTNSFDENMCLSIMETRTNYQNYIAPISNQATMFDGKYLEYLDRPTRDNRKDYDLVVSGGGCLMSATIYFPIIQKFYNELDDKETFKGFNFYYKPIDINNPFPNNNASNPLPTYSLWYDWTQSANKKPDLTKSYDKVTYVANTSGNESTIRAYNIEHPYTSWENMNINGKSQFIQSNSSIIQRTNDVGNIYKLGCGAKNTLTDVNHTLYQRECVE